MRWDMLRLFIAFWIIVGVSAKLIAVFLGWASDRLVRWWR